MVWQAAFHADLVKAPSTSSMVWIYSSENAIGLFLELREGYVLRCDIPVRIDDVGSIKLNYLRLEIF